MSQIFISHVEEDVKVALEIALSLEKVGYTTWFYELDSLPGPSYFIQTGNAIAESKGFILIISPDSLGSDQVTAEIVRAREESKYFIPILKDITHVEFRNRQLEWRQAVGAATAIRIPPEGVESIKTRIIAGLKGLGIQPISKPYAERMDEIVKKLDEIQSSIKNIKKEPVLQTQSPPTVNQERDKVKEKSEKREETGLNWKPITCICSLNSADCTPEAWKILVHTIDIAKKSRSKIAGTPHIFAAMLWSEQGLLSKGFSKLGIDLVPIKQEFNARSEFGKDKLPDVMICNIKSSESVIEILKLAQKNMLANSRNKVTEEDLLHAFVLQGGGKIGKILRERSFAIEALVSNIFKETGELDISRFDDFTIYILDKTVECARKKGHFMIGTRHLLYAMLMTEKSKLSGLLQKQGKDARQMANLLDTSPLMSSGKSISDINPTASKMSSGLIRILYLAEMSVKNEERWQVREEQILREFLSDSEGEAVHFLLKHGVKWSAGSYGGEKHDRCNIRKRYI